MTDTPSILGQNLPDPGIDTNLFTVPSNGQVQFSIFIANQLNNMDEITIAIIPAGGAETTANFIAFSTPIMPNAVMAFSGLFMNSGDRVQVQSKNGTSSFTATGILTTA